MEFLTLNSNVNKLEAGVRNTWRWEWMKERCDRGLCFEEWCRKINVPGKVYCILCCEQIVYGSSGKKSLRNHAKKEDHIRRSREAKTNCKLDSTSLAHQITSCQSLQDGMNEVKSVIGLFISENCLPFSLGPQLLKLAQRLQKVENKNALSNTTLSSTSATYSTTHGVAQHVKKEMAVKLKDTPMSLNIDEATTAGQNKVLNVLAQYYDENMGEEVINLIGSKQVNLATAANITSAVDDILKERGVDWNQIISVLMDNCSVMRGKDNGVEAKIRKEKNENLLDINGDTVHIVSNSAKALFSQVEKQFFRYQQLCSDIFYDIEDSPKQRFMFQSIQKLIGISPKSILRPIPTRFLQMKSVAERMSQLWDSLLIYYSAFITKAEVKKAKEIRASVFSKNVSTENRKQIIDVVKELRSQTLTDAGKARKEKIVNSFLDNQTKSQLLTESYIGILSIYEGFVKRFQSKKPMCHALHTELFHVTKSLFSCFILPEHVPLYEASKLKSLDVTDTTLHVKSRHLSVGAAAFTTLQNCLKNKSAHPWLDSFLVALKAGYVEAGKMMQKLPLTNATLARLAYLDPGNQRSSCLQTALNKLAEQLPNVIAEHERGALSLELQAFTVDQDVTNIDVDSTDEDFRLDCSWWTPIFKMRKQDSSLKYPVLTKLVKALMSIFSGPIVEGSFNTMSDIIVDDRTRMTQFNFEALAMTKAFLCSQKKTAVDYEIPKAMIKAVGRSYDTYQKYLSSNSAAASSTDRKQASGTLSSCSTSSTAPTLMANSQQSVEAKTDGNGTQSNSGTSQSTSTTSITDPQQSVKTNGTKSSAYNSIAIAASSPLIIEPHQSLHNATATLSNSTSAGTIALTTDTQQEQKAVGTKRKQVTLTGFFSKKPRVA